MPTDEEFLKMGYLASLQQMKFRYTVVGIGLASYLFGIALSMLVNFSIGLLTVLSGFFTFFMAWKFITERTPQQWAQWFKEHSGTWED